MAVENLPSKHKVLSSDPSTAKKEKDKRQAGINKFDQVASLFI
jgi:hypothetical protein